MTLVAARQFLYLKVHEVEQKNDTNIRKIKWQNVKINGRYDTMNVYELE